MSMAPWILICLVVAGFSVGYVFVKNNQKELTVQRAELLREMANLARQIDEAEGWIVRMEDRKNLSGRLARADSQLVPFPPSRVIKIQPIPKAVSPLPGTESEVSSGLAQNNH